MDSDTRRLVIGVVRFGAGMAVSGVATSYAGWTLGLGSGSSCFWDRVALLMLGAGGAVVAFARVILAVMAIFHKLGRST